MGGGPDAGLEVPGQVWDGAMDHAFDPDADVSDALVDHADEAEPELNDSALDDGGDLGDLVDLGDSELVEPYGDEDPEEEADYDDMGFDMGFDV